MGVVGKTALLLKARMIQVYERIIIAQNHIISRREKKGVMTAMCKELVMVIKRIIREIGYLGGTMRLRLCFQAT